MDAIEATRQSFLPKKKNEREKIGRENEPPSTNNKAVK